MGGGIAAAFKLKNRKRKEQVFEGQTDGQTDDLQSHNRAVHSIARQNHSDVSYMNFIIRYANL